MIPWKERAQPVWEAIEAMGARRAKSMLRHLCNPDNIQRVEHLIARHEEMEAESPFKELPPMPAGRGTPLNLVIGDVTEQFRNDIFTSRRIDTMKLRVIRTATNWILCHGAHEFEFDQFSLPRDVHNFIRGMVVGKALA